MRFNYLFIFTFLLFLFSCDQKTDYNTMITDIDDRLVILNDNIESINLSIDKIDKKLIELNQKINSISNNISIKNNNQSQLDISTNSTILSDTAISIPSIDFENLFYENYSISKLYGVITCDLKNIKENKIKKYHRGDKIKIFTSLNDTTEQIYKILEINKTRRYVKLMNLNYNKEFKLLFETDRQ